MKKAINYIKNASIYHLAVLLVTIGLAGGILAYNRINSGNYADTSFNNGEVLGCSVNSVLENSCRPWLGAWANHYTEATQYSVIDQTEYHESRLGTQLDIVHTYHPPGSNLFNSAENYFLDRSDNPYLFVNWKPITSGKTWADAGGGDATVNAYIDAAADAVSSTSEKIFLTVFHEPENDVSSGISCVTPAGSASMGSPADYVNMWHNVRSRFDAKGVDNVVWVMNYMSFSKWDCIVDDLWPGNSYVDWVVYDPYVFNGKEDFNVGVSRFYNLLTNTSNATHNYLSKPWGLGEFGDSESDLTTAGYTGYWEQAQAAVEANTYPKLKMFVSFDAVGIWDHRVGYDSSGNPNQAEQDAYNSFAYAVLGYGAATDPIPDPTPVEETPTGADNNPAPSPSPEASKQTIITVDDSEISNKNSQQSSNLKVDGSYDPLLSEDSIESPVDDNKNGSKAIIISLSTGFAIISGAIFWAFKSGLLSRIFSRIK